MRIVAVSTWFPTPAAPGSGVFVARDLAALAAHRSVSRIDLVHLVAPRLDDGVRNLVHDGVRVHRIPMAPTNPLDVARAARTLPRLLDRADVVHSMAISSLLPLVLRRPRAPWLHTEHWSALTNPGTVSPLWRAGLPAAAAMLRSPDAVTAVCEYLAEPIRRVRGEAPVAVVPCVVPPREVVDRPVRGQHPLRLVAVGALTARKDPLLAVETLAQLRRRGEGAHLTWVGDGPLRGAVADRAYALGVEDALELAGSRDEAGVSAALDAADLFLLPTRGDNFCVSAAEAIVHGRPVVVGATGGQGEYLEPAVSALVETQNATAYADAVLEVERRTRHLTAADIAATVGDRFAPERVAGGYVEQYRALLRAGRR